MLVLAGCPGGGEGFGDAAFADEATAPDEAAGSDAPLEVDVAPSEDGGFDADAPGDEGDDGGVEPDASVDAEPDGGHDAVPEIVPDVVEGCPRIYYLDPAGDDGRDGRSSATALLRLARVQELLRADPPPCDVEVEIAAGVYRREAVVWQTTWPDRRITFRAADRTDRPVFDGCTAAGSCPGGTFFTLRAAAGEATNLHFWYLRVRNYQTAISLNGNRDAAAASNGHNRIYGCYFERIGNVYDDAVEPSTACVRLVNSDDNEIENNHFVDVVNTRDGGLIHGIYAAHMSDRNTIRANRFLRSTGDPIRLRDYSNDNAITENRLIRVGTNGGYTDWYCDHEVRTDCTKPTPECPSWNNQFRDNVLDGTWACGTLPVFHYFQDDTTAGCSPPSATAVRLRTSGNTQTATPCSLE